MSKINVELFQIFPVEETRNKQIETRNFPITNIFQQISFSPNNHFLPQITFHLSSFISLCLFLSPSVTQTLEMYQCCFSTMNKQYQDSENRKPAVKTIEIQD